MDGKLLFAIFTLLIVAVHGSFFEVRYPSVAVSAETGGNLSIVAGPNGGNIYMNPGDRGTVYIGHTDMLKLFDIVNSLPPIWGQKSPYGSLGTFLGGDKITINLTAIDPEGTTLRYEKVSGALPPGVHLDKNTGVLSGFSPDVDATYEFGIRVIDEQEKYADQTFTIDTRERNQCLSNPCQHNGQCIDEIGSFSCSCTAAYGGKTCSILCENEAVGVSNSVRKIPDAQMSGHYAYSSSDHKADEGRLGSPTGWIGEGSSSWLQVDLGSVHQVHAVSTQGYTSSYTLSTYTLDCSIDGNTFTHVHANNTSTTKIFNGSGSSYSSTSKQVLPASVDCRYVRFIPRTWTSSHPGFRVEIYACEI